MAEPLTKDELAELHKRNQPCGVNDRDGRACDIRNLLATIAERDERIKELCDHLENKQGMPITRWGVAAIKLIVKNRKTNHGEAKSG